MSSFTASRLLKYVNILIAALLAAALALVWWYGYRPLAQTSGTAAIPAAAPVSVRFDGLGEPHIRAASQEDALVAQGYVTAQDRLWQMEGLRRAAAGDLAEIIGPTALDSDRESRRMRMRRIAEQAYTTLPAEDRAAFAAYARGSKRVHSHTPWPPATRIQASGLRAAPVEHGGFHPGLPLHVPLPDQHVALRSSQGPDAGRGQCGEGEPVVPRPHG